MAASRRAGDPSPVTTVRAPSGVELEVREMPKSPLGLVRLVGELGRTWIPPAKDLDADLRLLDRPALKELDVRGAQSSHQLRDALAKGGSFRSERLGTDLTPAIVDAWLELALRRRLIERYAEDRDPQAPPRWVTTDRGHEQTKSQPVLAAVPKAIGFVAGTLSIVATTIGGAAVLSQILEDNLEVVGGVLLFLGGLALYLLLIRLLLSRVVGRLSPLRVAVLQILDENDVLELPAPG